MSARTFARGMAWSARIPAALAIGVFLALAPPLVAQTAELDPVIRRAVKARGLDPEEIVVPNALSPEMRGWLDRVVQETSGSEHELLEGILRGLLAEDGLKLVYARGYTATAAEAFAAREANCLAFTNLFVGLAREAGLDVYYVKVDDVETYDKEGDLVLVSEHVTAGYGPPGGQRYLDFSIIPVDYQNAYEIEDVTALALFYSNRGSEALLRGQESAAASWLETAVQLDPELPQAWVNLGVARRRQARFVEAEAAYRRALEIDADVLSAYHNLGGLLQSLGRTEEAAEVFALVDRVENRNPYNYLALGDLSLKLDRVEEAGRYYQRALELLPEDAELRAALGQWAMAANRPRRARRELKKAMALDPSNARVRELAALLERPPA